MRGTDSVSMAQNRAAVAGRSMDRMKFPAEGGDGTWSSARVTRHNRKVQLTVYQRTRVIAFLLILLVDVQE